VSVVTEYYVISVGATQSTRYFKKPSLQSILLKQALC